MISNIKFTTNFFHNATKTLKYLYNRHLKVDTLEGKWHTLNHYIILIKYNKIVRFNPLFSISHLKSIIAFLVTLYEFDSFSKILVAVGIPKHSETAQIRLYSNISRYYIIRWLPGMLTSRFIISRDFVRRTVAKSPIVRYNLKYMRTTVYKLYNIPDLVVLSTMDGVGSIVAKEAILMKVPAIGLATTQSFPAKIAFRFFGDTSDILFVRSFLAVIGLGMRMGRELSIMTNFLSPIDLVEEHITISKFDPNYNPFVNYNIIEHDEFIEIKSFVINSIFSSYKSSFFFFKKSKFKTFKKYYKSLDLKLYNFKSKSNQKYNKIFLRVLVQRLEQTEELKRHWLKEQQALVEALQKEI